MLMMFMPWKESVQSGTLPFCCWIVRQDRSSLRRPRVGVETKSLQTTSDTRGLGTLFACQVSLKAKIDDLLDARAPIYAPLLYWFDNQPRVYPASASCPKSAAGIGFGSSAKEDEWWRQRIHG